MNAQEMLESVSLNIQTEALRRAYTQMGVPLPDNFFAAGIDGLAAAIVKVVGTATSSVPGSELMVPTLTAEDETVQRCQKFLVTYLHSKPGVSEAELRTEYANAHGELDSAKFKSVLGVLRRTHYITKKGMGVQALYSLNTRPVGSAAARACKQVADEELLRITRGSVSKSKPPVTDALIAAIMRIAKDTHRNSRLSNKAYFTLLKATGVSAEEVRSALDYLSVEGYFYKTISMGTVLYGLPQAKGMKALGEPAATPSAG